MTSAPKTSVKKSTKEVSGQLSKVVGNPKSSKTLSRKSSGGLKKKLDVSDKFDPVTKVKSEKEVSLDMFMLGDDLLSDDDILDTGNSVDQNVFPILKKLNKSKKKKQKD